MYQLIYIITSRCKYFPIFSIYIFYTFFFIFRTEFYVQCVLSRLCGGHHQYEQSASPKNRFVPPFFMRSCIFLQRTTASNKIQVIPPKDIFYCISPNAHCINLAVPRRVGNVPSDHFYLYLCKIVKYLLCNTLPILQHAILSSGNQGLFVCLFNGA